MTGNENISSRLCSGLLHVAGKVPSSPLRGPSPMAKGPREKVADRPDEGTLFPYAFLLRDGARKFYLPTDRVICQARKELARI
jgi:hypothetical protein